MKMTKTEMKIKITSFVFFAFFHFVFHVRFCFSFKKAFAFLLTLHGLEVLPSLDWLRSAIAFLLIPLGLEVP